MLIQLLLLRQAGSRTHEKAAQLCQVMSLSVDVSLNDIGRFRTSIWLLTYHIKFRVSLYNTY
jgi:activator of HSP90 ATPase